jgi:plastocyanin
MRKLFVVALVGTALAAAGPAHAARSWIVWADSPSNPPADLKASVPALNQFLPGKLQIHVGDKVTFKSKAFHTATFLGTTPQSQMPLVMPDPASKYSGVLDALGMPFWFNGGPPKFIFNPQAFQAVGSPVVANAEVHSSGNFAFIRNHQYTFTFTKAGTYKVVCLVHPGMQGTIVVKAKRAKTPSRTKVAAALLKQLKQSWATARLLRSQVPSDGRTVYAGVGSKTVLLAFQPRRLTVPAGTTVTWVESSPSEVHNIAFGDESYILRLIEPLDLFPVVPGAPNQVNPFTVFGSEPPRPYEHTGSNHGNGFLATPNLDKNPNSPPPESFSVKFTKPGTYHYICMIHGKDMSGDIVVTG